MREVSQRWAMPADRADPLVVRDGLSVTWAGGLSQTLISGDLDAARKALGAAASEVGLCGIAGPEALVRLARDRAVLVSETGEPDLPLGWHPHGFAVTTMSDAWAVFDIAGPRAAHLVAQGAAIDLTKADASPSAALLFAGCWAILYRRFEDAARLHVERPLAPYLTNWISAASNDL